MHLIGKSILHDLSHVALRSLTLRGRRGAKAKRSRGGEHEPRVLLAMYSAVLPRYTCFCQPAPLALSEEADWHLLFFVLFAVALSRSHTEAELRENFYRHTDCRPW